MRDAPFGLFPDLVRGRFVMREPVRVVVVLIGIKIFSGILDEDLTRDELRAVSRKHGIGLDDLDAITSQNSFAPGARILR